MRIAILNWRDTRNPEGGGSEVYIEQIAQRLVERGHEVTLLCAAHERGPEQEWVEGVRVLRAGSKLTVYSRARARLRSGELGPLDVIVDTQNGIGFLAPWATRTPVVVLVHHVHREQWPVVYDPVRARVGWWIESRLAPRVYRERQYVAVSEATRRDLVGLGIPASRIAVIHNGTTMRIGPAHTPPDAAPRILVLGRLVPHKRVEHVLLAAKALRHDVPGLTVAVVGDGWWAQDLRAAAREIGVDDIVEFTGHVDEREKERQIERAWVLALPSLKEGWGLVVMEAAAKGVPTVAYREAGGVTESVHEGVSGLIVDGGVPEFTGAVRQVLIDADLRRRLGPGARTHAHGYSWDSAADRFEAVLNHAAEGQPVVP